MYKIFTLNYDYYFKIKKIEFRDFCDAFDSFLVFMKLQGKYFIDKDDFTTMERCFIKTITVSIKTLNSSEQPDIQISFCLDIDLSVMDLIIRRYNPDVIDKNKVDEFNRMECSYIEKIKLLPTLLD